MLKHYVDIFRRLMIVVDMCLVSICFFVAYWVRAPYKPDLEPLEFYIRLWPVLVMLWAISLSWVGMYNSFRFKPLINILANIVRATLITFVSFGAVLYLFKIVDISRSLILSAFMLSMLVLMIEKFILVFVFREIRLRGLNFQDILIVGTNDRAKHFIRKLDHHRDMGLKIKGIIDEDEQVVGQKIQGHEIIGTFDDLPDILAHQAVDHVFFIVPRSFLERIEPLIRHCEIIGITVSVAVDLFDLQFAVGKEENILNLPLITFQTVPDKTGQLMFKRVIDILLAIIIFVVISPLYVLTAVLIKATSSGPVYFVQERYGLYGRRFKLYKFRTMVPDAEDKLQELLKRNEMQGPAFKLSDDPRVTPLGRTLRKLSIDELPQLWNVLQGDMSLVGPRPPIPCEVEKYRYWQRRRLSMRPGITCLWQVSGRNNIVDFNQWAQLDLEYIDNWSLKLDFKILLRTISAVISGAGAR
jgi:exopolysaccharide biosynthesis polyprenyl glycosylphosphotransferase